MSRRVVQRPRAAEDVRGIVGFIADDNPEAALRFFDAYVRTLETLRAHPARGRRYEPGHPALGDIRVVAVSGFRSYLIFSRTAADSVEIVRVLHGARDILSALEAELPPEV